MSVRQKLPFLDLPKLAIGNDNWQTGKKWSVLRLVIFETFPLLLIGQERAQICNLISSKSYRTVNVHFVASSEGLITSASDPGSLIWNWNRIRMENGPRYQEWACIVLDYTNI